MNNLNSVLIEGKMVRDPLVRTTPRGKLLCTFSLASNRFYRQESGYEKEVSFFDVEAWTRLAEDCGSHGKKGRSVRVVGRLKQDRWNGTDGKMRSRVNIVAEHIEFRPEFSKEHAAESPTEDPALEAAACSEESPPIDADNEDGGIPVMTELLEPAVF